MVLAVLCPVCRTAGFIENVSPGMYRCTAQILADVISPGTGPNYGPTARPIYRRCNTTFEEKAGIAAAARIVEERAADERKMQAHEASIRKAFADERALEDRKKAALAALKAAGNPGRLPRSVPGRWSKSTFGRTRKEVLVDVEPAWLVGRFLWRGVEFDNERFEKLDTGYTASDCLVPMKYAAGHDLVESYFSNWSVRTDDGRHFSSVVGAPWWLLPVVEALEAHVPPRRR